MNSSLPQTPLPETVAGTRRRICLTPTRNEAWIIRPFLAATRLWAHRVIVADQRSTDGTAEILRGTPGVEAVVNDSPTLDEAYRQNLLLRHARADAEPRVLFGLDADEVLSANALTSREWDQIEAAAPGTVLRFRWVNILPGFQQAWVRPGYVPLGFVDDGAPHQGIVIHSPRVPHPPGAPVLDLQEIVVLHFQYVVWERMLRKQRWYQAWEYARRREKGPLDLYRQYNHMHGGWNPAEIEPVRREWLEGYERLGIDFRSLQCEPVTWWDREVLQMLQELGPAHFRRLAIWDCDWTALARRAGLAGDFRDPRSPLERLSHVLLQATQRRRGLLPVRAFERLLRSAGW